MGQQIVFSILAIVTLVSAFIVVTDRNLFHAAIAMMMSFLGVAGFYAMLNSGFMAAAQLLVYIGAISILVIFAIMMTRRLMSADEPAFNSLSVGSAIVSIMLFGVLSFVFWVTGVSAPAGQLFNKVAPPVSDAVLSSTVVTVGELLVSPNGYVVPFEVISVLLLAALVGAIVVARPTSDEEDQA